MAVQWLRLDLSMQEKQVPFLVGNLGPNIPHSQKTSTETAEVMVFNNRVTNSVQTVHIKKKILKIKEAEEKLCASSQVCKWKQNFISHGLSQLYFSLPLCL